MGELEGRRAVVTGASRGIGAAIAERLVAEGAAVVITARTLEHHDHLAGSLLETVERCARHADLAGGSIHPLVADLADADDRATIIERARGLLDGGVDIVVNNAAAAIHAPLADFPLRRRRLMYEVNVEAPLDLAQAALPAMRDRGEGWIVNLTSAVAHPAEGPPYPASKVITGNGIYGASKAALNRLTNALAAELWGTGIRVNAVDPFRPIASEGALQVLGDRVPDDFYGPVEVMAEAVLALSTCPPEQTGHLFRDQLLLDELSRPARTLDGTRPLA